MKEKLLEWMVMLIVLFYAEGANFDPDERFWLMLASPDGNSGRSLQFTLRPKKNPFSGPILISWHKYELRKFEAFLAKRLWLYPSW